MRSIRLTFALTVASLLMLGITVAVTFQTKASDNALQRDLPHRMALRSSEVRDTDTRRHLASTTATPYSRLVATHSFGGSTWTINGNDTLLYYNTGAELVIADISNPSAPSLLGRWTDSNKSWLYNIQVADTLLYVPHGFSGVDIVDVSNAGQPVKVGKIPIRYLGPTTSIHDVEVAGKYAYVPQGSWFRVVDVTTPTLPTDVAVIKPTTGFMKSIAVSDDYAYITAFPDGLIVVDISTPTSPVAIGTLDTPGDALGIVKQGNHVYISERYAIQVVDVSNPYAPVQVGVYQPADFHPSENILISGDFLYLQDRHAGVHIVDVSDPSTPTQTGVLVLPIAPGDGLHLSGSTLYLGTLWDGLAIVDVSEPSSPSFLNTLGEMPYAHSIAGADGGVFVASKHDLWYLRPQVSSVEAMLVWNTPLYLGEIAERDGLAFLTKDDDMFGIGYLEILDVSNPYSPISQGTASLTIQGANSIVISNTYAYVGSRGGVSAVNIANQNAPYETSSVSVGSSVDVRGVFVEGNHLYAATTAGLKIFDVSDPATLNFAGEYPGVYASAVAVNGRYAYLGLGSTPGFQIIDVFTPTAPALVRTLNTCGTGRAIAVSNGYAYLADGCSNITLYDVSDPSGGPDDSMASADLPSIGEQVLVDGDEVSVVAGRGGFVKLQQLDGVSDHIPATGGSLTSPDGDVTINVPADTYTTTVRVHYEEELAKSLGSLRSGGPIFTLSAYYTGTWELAPLRSGKSMIVTLDYLPSSVREETLQLYSFTAGGTAWVPISSTVDTDARQVTAQLTWFTGRDTFALLGESHQIYLPLILR